MVGQREHGASSLQGWSEALHYRDGSSTKYLLIGVLPLQLRLFVGGSVDAGKDSQGVLDTANGWAQLLAGLAVWFLAPSLLRVSFSSQGGTTPFEPRRGGRGLSPVME